MPDGNFEELSPTLGRASAELGALGIPAETALEVAAEIRKHASAVAEVFLELFVKQVWKPFEDQGSPEHDLPAVRHALERLRPLASDALLAMFQIVMTEAVEERVPREVERIGAATAPAPGARATTLGGAGEQPVGSWSGRARPLPSRR